MKYKGVNKVKETFEFDEEMEFVKKEDLPKPNYAAWTEDRVHRDFDDYIGIVAKEE